MVLLLMLRVAKDLNDMMRTVVRCVDRVPVCLSGTTAEQFLHNHLIFKVFEHRWHPQFEAGESAFHR